LKQESALSISESEAQPNPALLHLERVAEELRKKNKELEAALAAAKEAAQNRTQFLAAVSHEIRTPMTSVVGMAELLLCTALNPEQRHYAETIKEAAGSLLRIVNDILDFAKIEAGKLELESVLFDLRLTLRAVTAVLLPQAHAKALKIYSELAPDVPRWVIGDPGRLRQVLVNVAGNAVKFTERGWVRIAAELADGDSGRCIVRFRVDDTGIGIPEDQLERIFGEFTQADSSTTRRFGGTGLGLSIARRLVELMGGQIGCTSRVGEGSSFWFTVPLTEGSEPLEVPTAGPTACFHGGWRRRRVLVVEDNPVNRTIAVRLLAREGCEVDAVETGREAVEICASSEYDLVLMDIHMPEMDGYEATRRIRAQEGPGRRTPIVAVTASSVEDDRRRCLESGMDDFLSKPFDADGLRQLLERWAPARAIGE
jgi:signal transduction histidine kinase/ActR/RegA family two-component response regulator